MRGREIELEVGDGCGGGTLVDLLNSGFEAYLVERRFGGCLGEQRAADTRGFDERRRLAVTASEVGAGGPLILKSFQLLPGALKSAFVARGVDGEGLLARRGFRG